ncbi:MAG: hypothetical protein ACP5N7_06265 [Candidatus Pacearchaeota archaeon]
MNKRTLWKSDEEQFLKDNYTTMSLQEIAEYIGRSKKAVNKHAGLLGLTTTNPDYERYNTKWTKQQLNYLKQHYSSETNEQLSSKLGHTIVAIQTKAQALKLTANHKKWTKNELKLLEKLYTVYTVNDLEQQLQRPKSSIVRKAYKIGIAHPKNKTTLEQDFAKFLIENKISFKEQISIWKYRVDFIVGHYAIETHGTYWHCDPRVYLKGPIYNVQKHNIQNDLNKQKYLEKHGYEVLVVWEKDFYEDLEKVKQIVPLLRNQ